MTLQNLAKIGQLKPHAPAAAEIQRLLIAVKRNLADAAQRGNSDETRFDCAYKAIMQCALTSMLASGYRPSALFNKVAFRLRLSRGKAKDRACLS